ncbi:MAG: hypothetical protein ACREU3_05450 [Steroidobacteraceae bacterium]
MGPWALADWRDEVRRQIAQLSRETGAFGREAVLIIEPAGGGRVLAAQRFPGLTVAHFSRDDEHPDIDQNVIPFADRARAARTWMDMGAAQLTRPAVEKVALFRNRELNHLTSQLSSAGNGSDPEKVGALAAAFWAGVHECYLSPHLRERAINMRRPGLLKRILPRRRTDAEIAREKRLAAYPALRADYEARKAALIARTRLKLGDPHWLPRSNIALAEVGPPPRNPFAAVPVRGELMHSDD